MTTKQFTDKYPDTFNEVKAYLSNHVNFIDAWLNCQRGDWMLWAATKLGLLDDHRFSVLVSARVAETVRHLMPAESSEVLDVYISYGLGTATREEFDAAQIKGWAAYLKVRDVCRTHADYATRSAAAFVDAPFFYAKYAADLTALASADAASPQLGVGAETPARAEARAANRKAVAEICRSLIVLPN